MHSLVKVWFYRTKRYVPDTNMLCKRQTSYEYDKNFKKNHRNFSEHQRFRQIILHCQRWLKRQGVTAPLARTWPNYKKAFKRTKHCKLIVMKKLGRPRL